MPELHPDHEQQANHPSRKHPMRHVLTRAVGVNEEVAVDLKRHRIKPGDSIVLCSDGLWELVLEYEMAEIINAAATPQEACDKLIALANERGGHDNISVIVIKPSSV